MGLIVRHSAEAEPRVGGRAPSNKSVADIPRWRVASVILSEVDAAKE